MDTHTFSLPLPQHASAAGNPVKLPLNSLAIAPPAISARAAAMDGDETASSISSSSSECNAGDTYASGSFTCSSLSSAGQLSPPFSLSSNSSSLNIADHDNNVDIACNHAADTQEERVADSQAIIGEAAPLHVRQATARRKLDHNKVARAQVRGYAAEIVRREAKALLDLAARLDPEVAYEEDMPRLKPEDVQDNFSKAVEILQSMDTHGKIIMTGVGKSGLLARKAVATFNSFGIPSAFLHPVEALHGDMGLLSPYGVDTVILISYSGRTAELLHLLQHLRRRRIHSCISFSSPDSALAEACDVNIDVSLENDEEAEDSVPAPTSSVLTALAALDALALTLLRLKTGWNSHISERRSAFGLHHPGGSLGQQLSSTVEAV